jgi:hypothetical protein
MDQSQHQYKNVDSKGNLICSQINDTKYKKCRDEKTIQYTRPVHAVSQKNHDIQDSIASFNKRILGGNSGFAFATPSSQRKPACHGDQVIPAKLVAAAHTVGPFQYDRLFLRYAVDAHVQKASDQYSVQQYDKIYENGFQLHKSDVLSLHRRGCEFYCSPRGKPRRVHVLNFSNVI